MIYWLAGAAVTGVGLTGYAFAVEPALRLKVKRYAFTPPNWTPGLKLRIAVIADPHLGAPHMTLERFEKIIDRCNATDPDVIVLLGDYAARHRFVTKRIAVSETARACRKLQAKLGVYCIQGNHDWTDDIAAQKRRTGPTQTYQAFVENGITVLENDAVQLNKDGKKFWVLGLGDQRAFPQGHGRFTGVDDLPGTLEKVSDVAPAILLAHEPDIFTQVPDRISLTLCGHTHGGQVRIFGWAPVVPSKYGARYVYGHIVESNRHLIVSGGLGTSGLPVRFGSPPEINVIDLG